MPSQLTLSTSFLRFFVGAVAGSTYRRSRPRLRFGILFHYLFSFNHIRNNNPFPHFTRSCTARALSRLTVQLSLNSTTTLARVWFIHASEEQSVYVPRFSAGNVVLCSARDAAGARLALFGHVYHPHSHFSAHTGGRPDSGIQIMVLPANYRTVYDPILSLVQTCHDCGLSPRPRPTGTCPAKPRSACRGSATRDDAIGLDRFSPNRRPASPPAF